MMKIGFYVSGKATRLKKILLYLNTNKRFEFILKSIVFVFNDENDLELNKILNDCGIKLCCNSKESVSNQLLDIMEQLKIDYLFVFGVKILKGNLLCKYKNKIINFHPSLLPAFKGLKAIDQCWDYGSIISGNTAFFIDEGTDTGPVIMQNIEILDSNKNSKYDILDNQIVMFLQIYLWIKDKRISIENRKVKINNAKYVLGKFVPSLEFVNEL